MSRILVTHEIDRSGLNFLEEKGHKLNILRDSNMKLRKEELIAELDGREYSALLTLLTVPIDSMVIDALSVSGVKVVANYAVGFDNIDIEYTKSKGIIVTNTPDVLTNAVAEFAVSMLLACSKRIVESDRFIREGKFSGWEPGLYIGRELSDKTLGILGFGRIGKRVAEIMQKGFNMKIKYYDIKKDENSDYEYCSSLDEVLQDSDFISVHLPLLDSTRGMLDESKLSLIKKDTVLVNTSRGPIIKEDSLKKMLSQGSMFYAGLDVFENEPSIAEGLIDLDNVILTPHIASATLKTRSAMSLLCAENINLVLYGEEPKTRVC